MKQTKGNMRSRSRRLWDAIPFAGMMMVECSSVGLITLSKASMLRGMSNFIFVMYSYALATLLLLPSAFFCRRATLPPITVSLLCRLFLLGLIGYLVQVFAYTGINYSSPTLASAMSNLIPAFTFILAIIFRMEKLDLRSSNSQAKSLGTLVSIAGAFVVTLYKGPSILTTPSPSDSPHLHLFLPNSNWVIGGLFVAADCLLSALWYIFQASIVKEYPQEFTLIFFYSFFATIQSAIVCLLVEREPSKWRLRLDLELFTIVYSAVFGFGFSVGVQTWCLRKKGPFFVAMFRPLGIVIAVVLGIIFLGDILHIGSVIGSVIIALGFYAVMWGKAQEDKLVDGEFSSLEPSNQSAPLLL
ncbi:PREDICTED: WAT1-related protein At5g40240-like isoform X1 [Nelumbo nucifera]|uniref:WAT1-related protein n=2 Tax=Nelumbo nucifera TaxID=4432 RepID=A0A1U8Q905_NELNU|nr:PREDICTED: WAT1-related protein At5g40240-like isoform X1 [Nelumbo nucifera]